MEITPKMKEYLDKAYTFDKHLNDNFKDPNYTSAWLEVALSDFLETGNIDNFVECLITVVEYSPRGIISQLAKDSGINRGNLSEIVNRKVKPNLDTAVKIMHGLGYECKISVVKKSA